jgi:hypothetical protein
VFTEAAGRLGNNLLAYAFLYQLKISLGIDAYISDNCRSVLERFFDRDSIKLPSLEGTFCNHKEIIWEPYSEHIRMLIKDKSYRQETRYI